MDVSSQMLAFVRVVEMGSISAASRASGQTPSAVSKQIGHLEDHVGQRLLRRSRSGVTLTPEGRAVFEKCRAVAEKFFEAEEYISAVDVAPKGELRVAASVAFGKYQLIPALPDFLAQNPDITLSLELTDRSIDLEEEQFDAAINFAEQLTNPNVIVRKIMRNERILCASPAFLARHGTPRTFADLADFNCLRTSNSFGRNAWEATLDGTPTRVHATGSFKGNSADAVFKAALAGLGIARLSTYIVADKVASGDLVHLFPSYAQAHADVAVTFAERRNLAPRIRTFVDFLANRFAAR
ncbi:LysR family transcriptional regulator [Sulfitobacter aestuariivivens]|uniref:LysR family transcriptional regulator n=1 Tax=Sulfitobacter aestuariivivens TaxID=2766981 RepID=A0A927HCW9_9RHOB|nr:LysR family transcriptional regulator [Sulfitobacter aestuariivivens]MBD3663037.1 LysR family transcriptional regulator [Sulfitobacter aestuariivivens]